jgi:hypothetical protein
MRLLRTAAAVGVASSVHGRVQRRQQQRWAAQDQAAAPAPAAAAATTTDKLTQLKTLADLRDSGALTEAEFELEKHKVLQG